MTLSPQVISVRTTCNGVKYAKVRILPEVTLSQPMHAVRLRSLDRLRLRPRPRARLRVPGGEDGSGCVSADPTPTRRDAPSAGDAFSSPASSFSSASASLDASAMQEDVGGDFYGSRGRQVRLILAALG